MDCGHLFGGVRSYMLKPAEQLTNNNFLLQLVKGIVIILLQLVIQSSWHRKWCGSSPQYKLSNPLSSASSCRFQILCWVQSCLTLATPWTVAHLAPLSMEFSRQEYWSGLPCPSPGALPDQVPRVLLFGSSCKCMMKTTVCPGARLLRGSNIWTAVTEPCNLPMQK